MEDWQIDFEWLRVQHYVKESMKRDTLPDLNAILLLIGVQELGFWKKGFTKEEKQDLMHIAMCRLLSLDEWFEFVGRDADGWPHYKQTREMHSIPTMEQEKMIKKYAIQYFKGNGME